MPPHSDPGRPSTPLGFGCAYITGGFEAGRSERLLMAAFDAGVRHFDTAPMYGLGTSEAVLGKAFQGKRREITITTKVGIARPKFSWKTNLIRAASTPVRRLLPTASRNLAAAAHQGSLPARDFSVSAVRRSLEESLRWLKTDYVDILLLHEFERDHLSPELLEALASIKTEGKALRVGIGSSAEAIAQIDRVEPDEFAVYQRTWSILKRDEGLYPAKLNVYHRAVLDAIGTLKERITGDAAFARRLSTAADLDVHNGDEVAKALIAASVGVNPTGLTLFASRRRSRVQAYARDAATKIYQAKGAALLREFRLQAQAVQGRVDA